MEIYNSYGVNRYFMQGYMPITDLIELKDWVLSKLMWNPKQDFDKLVETFCLKYYGPGAGPFIVNYINEHHDIIYKAGVQTSIGTNILNLDVWDESMYFLKKLPGFEELIERVSNDTTTDFYLRNTKKSSLSCLIMAFYRHLKHDVQNISLRFKWDFETRYVHCNNHDPLAVQTTKDLYDRIMLYKETEAPPLVKHDILREGHGFFMTKLSNGSNFYSLISHGYLGTLGGFFGPDGYNYIDTDFGGCNYWGWRWEWERVPKLNTYETDRQVAVENTTETLRLKSEFVSGFQRVYFVFREYKMIDNTLEVNYSVRNWYNGSYDLFPLSSFSFNLNDTRNVCYKINGVWKTIVPPKDLPIYLQYLDESLFKGGTELILASPVSKRGVKLTFKANDIQKVMIAISTRMGTLKLLIDDKENLPPGHNYTISSSWMDSTKLRMFQHSLN